MNKLLKDLPFKVYTTPIEKAGSSGERRIIRGYASVGDVLDRQNEVITLGALVKAREDLLKNHTIFYEHKHSELPIGKTIAVDIDDKGLLITVEISNAKHADPVWTLIQEGILNSFSIGGRVLEAEERRDKSGNLFNEITQIELFETSVVGLPANPAAKFELISKSFGRAITEEMKKREVSNMSEKETKKEVEETKAVVITDSTDVTTGSDAVEVELEVAKSEEVETEKSEETTEDKVEKSEEANEEATEEKEEVVEKSEEAVEVKEESEEKVEKSEETEEAEEIKEPVIEKSEETREDKKARLLKEIEDLDAEELAEKEANAEETTSSEEESSEEVAEETVEEVKSTDELILEKLSQLLDKFETKEEIVEVEAEKSEEEEIEVVEVEAEKSEEVSTEEAPVEELAVAKSEETVDLEKVVKIEDTPKEEKEEVTEKKETPTRKGEVIIAEAPYSNGEEDTKITKTQLETIKNVNWTKMIFGDK